jgi:hypothetical protein
MFVDVLMRVTFACFVAPLYGQTEANEPLLHLNSDPQQARRRRGS